LWKSGWRRECISFYRAKSRQSVLVTGMPGSERAFAFLNLAMQKILITGANGFVGNYLCTRLAPEASLIAAGRGTRRLSIAGSNLVYEALDLTDREAVHALIGRHRPDAIVHMAAISRPDECEQNRSLADQVNVEATRFLLEAAAETGAYFLFVSTDFVFDGQQGFYREEDPVGPVNYYGATKVQAETLVKNYPHEWSIVRTVLVYGAPLAGRENLLTVTAAKLRAGEEFRVFTDQVRTPTYVGDLVEGIVALLHRRAGGIWHLSGEDVRTPYEMAVETARYLNLDTSLILPVTEADMQQPARRPLKTGFDISKARRELGYQTTPFHKGLAMTFA